MEKIIRYEARTVDGFVWVGAVIEGQPHEFRPFNLEQIVEELNKLAKQVAVEKQKMKEEMGRNM